MPHGGLAGNPIRRGNAPTGQWQMFKHKNIIQNQSTYFGGKMKNLFKSNTDFSTIAWGAIFILWGITEMIPTLPEGTGAVGIGIILIALNVARSWKGQSTNSYTTTLGVLLLLLGTLELARPLLHLSFDIPTFAILLLTLGVILLRNALRAGNNQD
jgi:uncharacterized membrane protein HdeD (DUF308 family)